MSFLKTGFGRVLFRNQIPEFLDQFRRLNDNLESYLKREGPSEVWLITHDAGVAVCGSAKEAETRKAALVAAQAGNCQLSGPHLVGT